MNAAAPKPNQHTAPSTAQQQQSRQSQRPTVAIVGGGLVGATLALTLADLPLDIHIIEPVKPDQRKQPSFDDRSIALSLGSAQLLEQLGFWSTLKKHVCAIEHIHVSERGGFGFSRLQARDHQQQALGYVIENRPMGQALRQLTEQHSNLHWHCPAQVESLSQKDDKTELTLNDGTQLNADLVLAADGAQSPLRRTLGIDCEQFDYQQTAIVANVSTQLPHQGRAFERFTQQGPLALLPLPRNRMALVWTLPPSRANELLAESDEVFLAELQQAFGQRLGRITKTGRRSGFPLILQRAQRNHVGRVLLIGNAVNNLHPVAGQGFNLALRDLIAVRQQIKNSLSDNKAIGDVAFMHDYRKQRNQDRDFTVQATDKLVQLFSNDQPLLKLARNGLMVGLDLFGPAKNWLARNAMGFRDQ